MTEEFIEFNNNAQFTTAVAYLRKNHKVTNLSVSAMHIYGIVGIIIIVLERKKIEPII